MANSAVRVAIIYQVSRRKAGDFHDGRSVSAFEGNENGPAMRPVDASDFRAKRLTLEKDDFALASGSDSSPVNLIEVSTWNSIVALPDDVSIRTSNEYGSHLQRMWEYCDMWTRVVGGLQALRTNPTESPTATAACDAGDEFQAATYCALVGYYRVAFSCLRNVLEQITIAAGLTAVNDARAFANWRNGEEGIRFGWAADMLRRSSTVTALEQHLKATMADSMFDQAPKGLARRFFVELSKYTHGSAGFTDADFRQSNGPVFVAGAFWQWWVAALKTFAIVLHELKLVHPVLNTLPWGPPPATLDGFRRRVVADIPSGDRDLALVLSLVDFWS